MSAPKCSEPKCRAKPRLNSQTIDTFTYICKNAHHTKVATTPEMKKAFRKESKALFKKPMGMHKLAHLFEDKFQDTSVGVYPPPWKLTGYELMVAVDKWRARHPSVLSCSVDDDAHATSTLYFIPHENETEYWGTTVVYVPQCTGEVPIKFFLYPEHVRGLANTFKILKSNAFKKPMSY